MKVIWIIINKICFDSHTSSYESIKNVIYVQVNCVGKWCAGYMKILHARAHYFKISWIASMSWKVDYVLVFLVSSSLSLVKIQYWWCNKKGSHGVFCYEGIFRDHRAFVVSSFLLHFGIHNVLYAEVIDVILTIEATFLEG